MNLPTFTVRRTAEPVFKPIFKLCDEYDVVVQLYDDTLSLSYAPVFRAVFMHPDTNRINRVELFVSAVPTVQP